MDNNVIIIGGGAGGYSTAAHAVKSGLKTALVVDGPLGGVCLNEGCIPTKALYASAHAYESALSASTFGVNTGEVSFDFAAVQTRKDDIVARLREGVKLALTGVDLIEGKANFVDAGTIAVGDTTITADNIIVATGSVNAPLKVPGAEYCLGSRETLSLKKVPESMIIIGGGVIGIELASIYATFGAQVTVIEYCPEILPRLDSELAKRLRMSLKKKGIEFITGAAVNCISPDNIVTYTNIKKGTEATAEAQVVVMATGRRPNTTSLNFADLGIEIGKRGEVVTDAAKRTNVPNIYAIGDITGGYMLAHSAEAHGKIALADILGKQCNINEIITPAVVFASPMLAAVGLSEDECKSAGIAYKAHKSFYRANGKALCMGEEEGVAKILISDSGSILGAAVLGCSADLMIQQIADVMALGGSFDTLQGIIHAHPTLSEILIS